MKKRIIFIIAAIICSVINIYINRELIDVILAVLFAIVLTYFYLLDLKNSKQK